MNPLRQPGWLRALEVFTGVSSIALGILALAFPGLSVAALVVLLSIGLIFVGIRSISLVAFSGLSMALRGISAVAGVVSIVLAVVVLGFPGYGALTLVVFLSYGLVVYGFSRIYLAFAVKAAPGWLRALGAVVGVLDVIFPVVVLALPGLALLTLSVLLSLALLVTGAEILVSGVVGRTWLGNLVKDVSDVSKEIGKV
ncbi:MAG: DUF308 domain-containing protein [Conexivisphaerales archaeon]